MGIAQSLTAAVIPHRQARFNTSFVPSLVNPFSSSPRLKRRTDCSKAETQASVGQAPEGPKDSLSFVSHTR